jgi:hypothetical protein
MKKDECEKAIRKLCGEWVRQRTDVLLQPPSHLFLYYYHPDLAESQFENLPGEAKAKKAA